MIYVYVLQFLQKQFRLSLKTKVRIDRLYDHSLSNAVDLYLQSLRKFKLPRVKYFVKYFNVRFDFENSFIKECYLIVF